MVSRGGGKKGEKVFINGNGNRDRNGNRNGNGARAMEKGERR